MNENNIDSDGNMFELELDQVQIKKQPGHQMSAAKSASKKEKQELGILQENK